jgi:hypothetical protein
MNFGLGYVFDYVNLASIEIVKRQDFNPLVIGLDLTLSIFGICCVGVTGCSTPPLVFSPKYMSGAVRYTCTIF